MGNQSVDEYVLLVIVAIFLMPGTTPHKLAKGQTATTSTKAEFVPLFNGKDLTGWEPQGNGRRSQDNPVRL